MYSGEWFFEMTQDSTAKVTCTQLDRQLAIPMFVVALLFLLIGGFLLHTEPGEWEGVAHYSPILRRVLWIALSLLYVLYIGETIAHRMAGAKSLRQHWVFLAIPFMRLCVRDHVDGTHVWVPVIGWRKTTGELERNLSRWLSGPMIVISLAVLPVVVLELFWWDTIKSSPIWRFSLETVTGFIWMAFVVEFVIMISVVQKKFRYCKQNWIDLAIILLPLFAFLRVAQLGRLIKLNQVTRTAKIYRMRGLLLRSWRAIITLDMIDKILRRDPTFRIDKLEQIIAEKEADIELLRAELHRMREQAAKQLAVKQESG